MDAFIEAQNSVLEIMAIGAFPKFLMSKAFSRWRQEERVEAKDLMDAVAGKFII